MPTVMLILGSVMILGSGVFVAVFFWRPGPPIPGVSKLESADYPQISWLFEGFAMFAFGTFLFFLGLGWTLAGVTPPN